jgi:hypothetical protein
VQHFPFALCSCALINYLATTGHRNICHYHPSHMRSFEERIPKSTLTRALVKVCSILVAWRSVVHPSNVELDRELVGQGGAPLAATLGAHGCQHVPLPALDVHLGRKEGRNGGGLGTVTTRSGRTARNGRYRSLEEEGAHSVFLLCLTLSFSTILI